MIRIYAFSLMAFFAKSTLSAHFNLHNFIHPQLPDSTQPISQKIMHNSLDSNEKAILEYVHDTAISTAAKIMKGSSEFVGLKFGIEKLVETGAYPKIAYNPPAFIHSKKEVNTLIFQGRKVWTIKPKAAKKQVILYLHGGGYVANLSLVHWDFIQEIIVKTNGIVVVPDYPLSPDATYKELYAFMNELYTWMVSAYPDCEIVFMGDSAGGGLALGYAQLIQQRNEAVELNELPIKHPNKLILLSPWLDLGMKNPDSKPVAKYDQILSFEVLQMCAQAYIGKKNPSETELRNPIVSPLYGPYLNHTEIALFIGTHDLFWADSKLFKSNYQEYLEPLNSENLITTKLHFHEYPQMFHVWMLFTKLPESQSVITEISEVLN